VRMQIATYREHELSSKLFRDQAADLLLLRAASAALRQPDPQYIHWRRYETRQIEPLPSSLTMSKPSCATATRAAPDVAVVDHKTCQEILVFARRLVVPEKDMDDLVASPPRAVP